MPIVDVVVESPISSSIRARQVSAAFDVPPQEKARLSWKADLPIEANDWNVGLVVGPSGAGKSTIMRSVWGDMPELSWGAASVVDDFAKGLKIEEITGACSAVGFNTIPAWMRPYHVLSNGERFRVDLARRLLELPDPIVVDEFTSVVDRQVAKIGSHAVQKRVRALGRKFVAVTCHYDVIDWLQPDWVLDVSTMSFTRRLLQRRPTIDVDIRKVPRDTWRLFAPYHYMSAEMHTAAQCYAAHVDGRPVAFAGVMHRMHAFTSNLVGVSRLVTLPDWQGLGLAFSLVDALGAAHKAVNKRLLTNPMHPSLVRSFGRSRSWHMQRKPGFNSTPARGAKKWLVSMRPVSCFEYCGPAMTDAAAAARLLRGS